MQEYLSNIAFPLLTWYQENRRPLPWRSDREPYHVWISEIMLQQTRVEAVKKYYTRFMDALPDVKSLSQAEDDRLLKLWEGLGYYSRARNLKKAAQMIESEWGGVFPRSYQELLRLPGVGPYTAGAIASICFHEKVTAVDGNVLRVISRIRGSRKNVLLPETKKETEQLLTQILPDQAGLFNEALMELGELICLPGGAPLCGQCPLREQCVACREHLTAEIPVRIKTSKRRQEKKTVVVLLTDDRRTAIVKRPEKGLLSGLYQFPNREGFLSEKELRAMLAPWQPDIESISRAVEAKHVFTHIDWLMKGYLVRVRETFPADGQFLWITPEELAQSYPLPTAFRPFVPLLSPPSIE